jgi:CRP-like cAMP-binding protein
MNPLTTLRHVEIFESLNNDELKQVADICKSGTHLFGDLLTQQGESGEELFIITSGMVEVLYSDTSVESSPQSVVSLGEGQVFGEMALVDFGPRSATVRVISDEATLQSIQREDFLELCERDNHIGFIVMRNIAADLSFKLRHRNLQGR